jgi:hypothetical protein
VVDTGTLLVTGYDGNRSAANTKSRRSDWASLEIAKLLVPVVTSVVLTHIGLRLSENIESFKLRPQKKFSKSVHILMQNGSPYTTKSEVK